MKRLFILCFVVLGAATAPTQGQPMPIPPQGYPGVPTVPTYEPQLVDGPAYGGAECPGTWVCGPAGRVWARGEYLMWWTKGSPYPPLLTTSVPGTPFPGLLGSPGTSVVFGGSSLDTAVRSGARVTLGGWVNEAQTTGVEANFFYLEPGRTKFSTASDGSTILGRPFFNVDPFINQIDSLPISFPGILHGSFTANESSKFYGGDVYLRQNVYCDCKCRVDLLAGYRYLHLDEKFAVYEVEASDLIPGLQANLVDAFSTKNNFNGGEVGLASEFRFNRLFVQLTGKVAVGSTHQVVSIFGVTQVVGPDNPALLGGFLASGTNIGQYGHTSVSVVPEAGLNLGYQITDKIRVSVGYTFLYWTNVVRPGRQIDLFVNDTQFPPAVLFGPARPIFIRRESDYWAQGIHFSLEIRF